MRSRKTKLILILIIVADIASGLSLWLISDKFWQLRDQIVAAKNEINVAKNQDVYIRFIKKTLEDTGEKRAMIDRYFVGPDEVVTFIKELEASAKKLGLTATTLSVGIESGDETLSYRENLRVALKTLGSWDQIIRFVDTLGNLPYHLTVNSADLSLIEEGKKMVWSGVYEINVIKLK